MIFGLVLAGGRSSRFGAEKALAELGGRSLFDAALATLDGACAKVAVSAPDGGGAAALAAARGLPRLTDPPGLEAGPLAGILAGLVWAAGEGAEMLATTPCDTPFLPADLVERLAAALGETDGAAVARAGDGPHPLCGLWRTRLAGPLAALMKAGHPPVREALARLDGRFVDFPEAAAFANVNTREDLARAARSLAGRRSTMASSPRSD
ncbi:MAG: molybdenum cofactor guanylyltransferase [Caulobacteraceae bacterium]|nr:molybdenum cofactor guanylyltransferase [Caulobacteraceae bacterium]